MTAQRNEVAAGLEIVVHVVSTDLAEHFGQRVLCLFFWHGRGRRFRPPRFRGERQPTKVRG